MEIEPDFTFNIKESYTSFLGRSWLETKVQDDRSLNKVVQTTEIIIVVMFMYKYGTIKRPRARKMDITVDHFAK